MSISDMSSQFGEAPKPDRAADATMGTDLEVFLDQLSESLRSEGLRIGPRERIAASALVASLVSRGFADDLSVIGPSLAAVLARSREERDTFDAVFDRFARIGVTPRPTMPIAPQPKRGRWVGLSAIAAIMISIALAVVLWPPKPPPNQVVKRPPPPPATTRPIVTESAPKPKEAADAREALQRIRQAAVPFRFAPSLEELAGELDMPPGWTAAGTLVRLHELTGLPRYQPLPLFGADGKDGGIWARIALALQRMEKPGRESRLANLEAEAKGLLAKETEPSDLYRALTALPDALKDPIPRDKDKVIAAVQAEVQGAAPAVASKEGTQPRLDAQAIERALAISPNEGVRRVWPDAPWRRRDRPAQATIAPKWSPWIAGLVPLTLLVWWLANSLARRKAFLRRRPPQMPPLQVDLISEVAQKVVYPADVFRRIAQRLQTRTPRATQRIDVEATVAATVASGGLAVEPVPETVRRTPEYLVLIERHAAGDQIALRHRELIRRLEFLIPFSVYYYRLEPSLLEPERGGRPVPIEQVQAMHPEHRLLVLGTGAGFLEPNSLTATLAAEHVMYWERRALLTPIPLAEWSAEEFALARELEMPIGRATPDGLMGLAELLGLEGAEDRAAEPDPRGDGLARPLPEVFRLRPHTMLYEAPPSEAGLGVENVVRDLRNFLDGPGFEWLCAMAVYPAVQWDLTLYLGVHLPDRADGEQAAQLYSEARIAALTQLPWLREGFMPDWLRRALIAELSQARREQVRRELLKLLERAKEQAEADRKRQQDEKPDEEVRFSIRHEPMRDRLPPDELFDDDVFLEVMARPEPVDLVIGWQRWLERLLKRRRFDWVGWSEAAAIGIGLAYAIAAFTLTPAPGDGVLVTGAWLSVTALAVLGAIALGFVNLSFTYRYARQRLIRAAPWFLAFGIALAASLVVDTGVEQASLLLTGRGALPVFGYIVDATLVPIAAVSLLAARRVADRLLMPVWIASDGRWRRFGQLILQAVGLAFLLVIVRTGFAIRAPQSSADIEWALMACAVPIALFGLGWFAARNMPANLSAIRRTTYGAPPDWALGGARTLLALVPIALAFAISPIVSTSSTLLRAGEGEVTARAMTGDGSILALGGADGSIEVYSLTNAKTKPLNTIETNAGAVLDLKLRQESDVGGGPVVIAAASADGKVRMFDALGGSPLGEIEHGSEGAPPRLALGAGRRIIVARHSAAGETHILLPNRQSPSPLAIDRGGPVTAMALVGQGRLIVATLDGRLRIFEGVLGPSATRIEDAKLPSGFTGRRIRVLKVASTENDTYRVTAIADEGTVLHGAFAGERLALRADGEHKSTLKVAPPTEWLSGPNPGQPNLSPGTTCRDCQDKTPGGAFVCPEMVVIPAGKFTMGSPANEPGRQSREGPQREVTIARPFAVGKFEVTWDEWLACVAERGCDNDPVDKAGGDNRWGRGQRPVIEVDWDDAKAYATWLSAKTGATYRLLTEAEWEYAARAGTTTAYSWGADIGKGNANCDGCGSQWDDKQTAPVGSFKPNAFGLHDMHGNVWEWVEDCYVNNYEGAPADGSARVTSDCPSRVVRGGSWNYGPRTLRSADRGWSQPDDRGIDLGFRLARTLNPVP